MLVLPLTLTVPISEVNQESRPNTLILHPENGGICVSVFE